MAVFLSLILTTGAVFATPDDSFKRQGMVMGSGTHEESQGYGESRATLMGASPIHVLQSGVLPEKRTLLSSAYPATLQAPGQPMGIFSNRGGPISYKVKSGDTLSGIAKEFGISVQTITAANPSIRANALRIGQEIQLLPVSGVIHEVRSGETLEGIAEFYNLDQDKLREYNPSVNFGLLAAGTSLVIPGVTSRSRTGSGSALPELAGYFIQPTQGFNWGRLHYNNAVDVANSCGTRLTAAAEGLVVDAASDGWNNGYGSFILIEHPNETRTRYAHLEEVLVQIGDYVKQNQLIGTMGNTGNVHGPTGCHLHFEVEGARNPLVR